MITDLAQNIRSKLAQAAVVMEGARWLGKPAALVLCYHGVSSGDTLVDIKQADFLDQLKYLRVHFDIVPVSHVVEMAKGNKQITQPTVALTFDDGYKDLLDVVAPALSRFNIPATVFAMAKPERARRDELANDKALLTYDELRVLCDLGWTIGSHTLTHPDLSKLMPREVQVEVEESKQILESKLGVKVRYFAYPKGIMTTVAVHACQRAGYEAAFSAVAGRIKPGAKLYSLARVLVERPHSFNDFRALLTGAGQAYLRYKLLLTSQL